MVNYISFNEGLILIKLLMAHMLTDFIVQPKKWVDDKREKKHKSPYLYWHVIIAGVSTYLFIMQWGNWHLPIIILITHYLIDLWKLNREDNIKYFLLDQFFHIIVILVLWLSEISNWDQLMHWTVLSANNYKLWLILLGFIFVAFPAQHIMIYATKKWSDSFAASDRDTLKDAGKWIGVFERILILILVLYGQYEAIGFLIAGKSFIRFSETEPKTRAQTEYILIGTLISFTIAIAVGTTIAVLLAKMD